MPFFKCSQYEIIGTVIHRVTHDILTAKINDLGSFDPDNKTWQMGHQIMESFVDELCIEFAKDNRLFNETLFRTKCGTLISGLHAVVEFNLSEKEDEKI